MCLAAAEAKPTIQVTTAVMAAPVVVVEAGVRVEVLYQVPLTLAVAEVAAEPQAGLDEFM